MPKRERAEVPQGALRNSDAPDKRRQGSRERVAGMWAKLHRGAAANAGRFYDLFNFMYDSATLLAVFDRSRVTAVRTPLAWTAEEVGG